MYKSHGNKWRKDNNIQIVTFCFNLVENVRKMITEYSNNHFDAEHRAKQY